MKIANKNLFLIFLITTAIVLVPWIAMQFTTEVNWAFTDFLVAFILIFGTGVIINLTLRKIKNPKLRILLVSLVVFLLFLLWAELAVGVFNSPIAGN
ncbi:MAG: hypothetical protein CL526_08350 [Aequorivita sp.]|nr:hypothetical protein [Aequorivita sp.]|tara:strand:- start:900 stop:1190 length:291 start_codon:yes stop_codon:yes gene_type:complete